MNSQTFYRKIVAFAILVISFQIQIQTKLLAQNSSLILLKADTTLANEYFVRASQFSKESKFDSSTIYFRKASKIFRNLARKSDAKVHWVNFVKCHNNIARNYRINGEFEEALQTLDEALRIGRLKLGVMNLHLADSFEEKARIYDILGKRVEALSLMDTTVTILEEKTLNENDPRLGIAYDVIGIIHSGSRLDCKDAQQLPSRGIEIISGRRVF